MGAWAADCAEKVSPIYEAINPEDTRLREAISGIREFANGGKRAASLRKFSMDAYRAARDMDDPAASAAAQAASLAAASAYTHPLVDVTQTKHIVGPAAYAALAMEINANNDLNIGDDFVRWAIDQAPVEVREILLNMPARAQGKTRLDKLMFDLDLGIRNKVSPC